MIYPCVSKCREAAVGGEERVEDPCLWGCPLRLFLRSRAGRVDAGVMRYVELRAAYDVSFFIGGELGAPSARTVGALGPARGGAAPAGAPGAAAPPDVLPHIDALIPWFPRRAALARGSVPWRIFRLRGDQH